MARPTKFTPESTAVIVANLRSGGTLAGACRDVGIRLKTAEGWLRRGRREQGTPHAEFAAAIDEARERAKAAVLTPDEYDRHLAKAVRAGNVQAMKLWWEIHGKKQEDDARPEDPFEELDQEDELAKARAKARRTA